MSSSVLRRASAWVASLGLLLASPLSADEPATAVNSVGMKLSLLPAGEFQMGSADDDPDADADEKPRHLVKITKPFYIGQTEVTRGQWQAVMGTTPWTRQTMKHAGDHDPATVITRPRAEEFCRKLGEKEGKTYRLPTSAEWEYACRAGSTTKYHFGDDPLQLGEYAWFAFNTTPNREEYPHEVAQKQPNAWGLYDMHGNVLEWCSDWYVENAYQNSDGVSDPRGPAQPGEKNYCVMRGGGYSNKTAECRSALVGLTVPGLAATNLGFRVVQEK